MLYPWLLECYNFGAYYPGPGALYLCFIILESLGNEYLLAGILSKKLGLYYPGLS